MKRTLEHVFDDSFAVMSKRLGMKLDELGNKRVGLRKLNRHPANGRWRKSTLSDSKVTDL